MDETLGGSNGENLDQEDNVASLDAVSTCDGPSVPDRPPRMAAAILPPPVPPRTCVKHLEQIQKLTWELEEAKQLNAIALSTWSDEIQRVEKRYQEEIETVQSLMHESIEDAVKALKMDHESEVRRLKSLVNKLELELAEYKSSEKDMNVFSTMKTLARKVGNLTPNMLSASSLTNNFLSFDDGNDKEHVEQPTPKKAPAEDELLQSIVTSLEEEIRLLKDKLRIQDQQLQMYEANQVNLVRGVESVAELLKGRPVDQIVDELSSKIGEVSEAVTVGMNIADLELYTAMLNTQKAALMDEKERLKSQLKEVHDALESERLEHSKLRKAWNRAHDQYLVQQRAQLREIKRLKSMLTEQGCFPAPRKDGDEEQDSVITSSDPGPEGVELRGSSPYSCRKLSRPDAISVRSVESCSTASSDIATSSEGSVDMLGADLASQGRSSSTSGRSDSDDSCRMVTVSAEQWDLLRDEIKTVYKLATRTCTNCCSLRAENALFKEKNDDLTSRCSKSECELERLRRELTDVSKMFKDYEEKWLNDSRECEKRVSAIYNEYSHLSSKFDALVEKLSSVKKDVHSHVRQLKFDRIIVSREVTRLQEENDRLSGKHFQSAAQLINQKINLPCDVTELQEELLKIREELITAKIAKESAEEKMESEIKFYKEAADTERLTREGREEELSSEVNALREELGIVRSYQTQCEEEAKKNESLKLTLTNLKEQVKQLMEQLHGIQSEKEDKEREITALRGRITSLQNDLQTSEEVQRDFVKLSQTLQMQLENLRQAGQEVRWQHEDDVSDCPTCKEGFSLMKKKHRCKHCGHIFCGECLKYVVYSGPSKRAVKVCNVCYYLLVPESTPFFGQS